MVTVFYYLYYRLYSFSKKIGTVDATWTAMLLLSALLGLNLFSFLFHVGGRKIVFLPPIWMGAIVGITIMGINYFIFIRRDKCFEIIKKFESETRLNKVVSSVLTVVYIVITWYLADKDIIPKK